MKRLLIGTTLAMLIAAPSVLMAQDQTSGDAAGNIKAASYFSDAKIPIIVGIGTAGAVATVIAVVGVSDGGSNNNNSTSTATATTR